MQNQFPQSHHEFWSKLEDGKYTYDENTGLFSPSIPDSIKQLNGKVVELSGFVLPSDSAQFSKHFLLSMRTPLCFFHMPGGPESLIEVFSKEPVEWIDDIAVIKGTFTLTSNPEQGIFYQIKDAEYIKTEKVDWEKYEGTGQ